MNCTQWEERIALYAGSDLLPEETADVERHLGACPGCRQFASAMRENLEFLQDAGSDPIAPAHFAAVRARVLAKIANSPIPWWRHAWVYGLAAAAVLLGVLLVPHSTAPVHSRQVAVQTPPLSAPSEESADAPQTPAPVRRVMPRVQRTAAHRTARPRIQPAVARPDSGPPVVVKMLTDDPNVVIYWITDKSGE